jgi:hypothetical protein
MHCDWIWFLSIRYNLTGSQSLLPFVFWKNLAHGRSIEQGLDVVWNALLAPFILKEKLTRPGTWPSKLKSHDVATCLKALRFQTVTLWENIDSEQIIPALSAKAPSSWEHISDDRQHWLSLLRKSGGVRNHAKSFGRAAIFLQPVGLHQMVKWYHTRKSHFPEHLKSHHKAQIVLFRTHYIPSSTSKQPSLAGACWSTFLVF